MLQFWTRDTVKCGSVQTFQFRTSWSRNLFLHVLLVTCVTSSGTADSFFKQHTSWPWNKRLMHSYGNPALVHVFTAYFFKTIQILFIQMIYPSHASTLWAHNLCFDDLIIPGSVNKSCKCITQQLSAVLMMILKCIFTWGLWYSGMYGIYYVEVRERSPIDGVDDSTWGFPIFLPTVVLRFSSVCLHQSAQKYLLEVIFITKFIRTEWPDDWREIGGGVRAQRRCGGSWSMGLLSVT